MNSKSKIYFPMIKNSDFLICLFIIYYWSDAFKHRTLEQVMSDITDVQNSLNINFTGISILIIYLV